MSYFPRKRRRRPGPARRVELVGGPGDGEIIPIGRRDSAVYFARPGPGGAPQRWVEYRASGRRTGRGLEAFEATQLGG